MRSDLVLVGGPGDGEVIPGIHNGTYRRERSVDEMIAWGNARIDEYVLGIEEGVGLVGVWVGEEVV